MSKEHLIVEIALEKGVAPDGRYVQPGDIVTKTNAVNGMIDQRPEALAENRKFFFRHQNRNQRKDENFPLS